MAELFQIILPKNYPVRKTKLRAGKLLGEAQWLRRRSAAELFRRNAPKSPRVAEILFLQSFCRK